MISFYLLNPDSFGKEFRLYFAKVWKISHLAICLQFCLKHQYIFKILVSFESWTNKLSKDIDFESGGYSESRIDQKYPKERKSSVFGDFFSIKIVLFYFNDIVRIPITQALRCCHLFCNPMSSFELFTILAKISDFFQNFCIVRKLNE